MATIGRRAAVADVHGLTLRGTFGWLAWLLVHIYYLIGFRNRAVVLASWGWNYLARSSDPADPAQRPRRGCRRAGGRSRCRRAGRNGLMEDARRRAVIERLLGRRRELEEELARLVARQSDPSQNVSFGKRIGDGTTEAVERYNRTAAATPMAANVVEIDRALEKLEEGTYGLCEDCGEAIPQERLDVVPWATTCVRCRARRASGR